MIRSIKSNNPKFKTVNFRDGYNIILADRKRIDGKNDQKQTRNGAGKTTLIEIIHFCLGARVDKKSVFKSEHLQNWSFILTIDIDNMIYELERRTNDANKVYIHGNLDHLNWECKYDKKEKQYYMAPVNLNRELLYLFFGIEKSTPPIKYTPSFRELISYTVRRTTDGFRDAFEYYPKQQAYSRQTCNAYFLDLNMDYASAFQELKDKTKGIADYKKAANSGVIGNISLNIGDLNTEVIMRQKEMEQLKQQIDSFQVHPQYSEVTKLADKLTAEIQQYNNTIVVRRQLLTRYEESVKEEEIEIPVGEIEKIYAEAGILFGDTIRHNLDAVMGFHRNLIANRKEYLHSEVLRLRQEISGLEVKIKDLSNKRAENMSVLNAHGALEEYTQMQTRYASSRQSYDEAKNQLEAAEYIEDSKSRLKIDNQELLIKSRRDYSERIDVREKAIFLFKEATEFLYPEAGTLTIDLKETGYTFGVDIKSSKSQGVGYMKVLCYDMVLLELGMDKDKFPDFWVHDSSIFDGVDERQIARALMLAKNKSEDVGFQYICMLNSDQIPEGEFDEEFKKLFQDSVILRLDDETEDGGLLGIRF
jgi:Uncharacterized protein conserved in bacteria